LKQHMVYRSPNGTAPSRIRVGTSAPLNTVCIACKKELPRYLLGKLVCRDAKCRAALADAKRNFRTGCLVAKAALADPQTDTLPASTQTEATANTLEVTRE